MNLVGGQGPCATNEGDGQFVLIVGDDLARVGQKNVLNWSGTETSLAQMSLFVNPGLRCK